MEIRHYEIPGYPGYTLALAAIVYKNGSKVLERTGMVSLKQQGEPARSMPILSLLELTGLALPEATTQKPPVATRNRPPKKPEPVNKVRLCHDCKKPSGGNYRCPACLKKWRIKNGVSITPDNYYGDFPE